MRLALLAAPLLMLSLVALAEPKRSAKDADDKAVPARVDKEEPKAEPAASRSLPEDLGVAPPSGGSSEERKLSPLNPEANEFADGGSPAAPADFDKLLADIATLRGRVSALTTTLFASKLRVVVETRGSDSRIARFTVTLDEGVVFTAPERFVAEDERTVYEHSVAPGHHVLGVELERFDARDRQYRSWQISRFSVLVPESKRLDAHLTLQDASQMGKDFAADQDGEYELKVRLRARVEP